VNELRGEARLVYLIGLILRIPVLAQAETADASRLAA
jgi:hypothetical protein